MAYIFPKSLKFGDTIAVISPSSPVTLNSAAVNKGLEYLRDKGFKVVDYTQKKGGFSQRSIKEKASIVNKLFANKSIAAIMAFWGGLTSNQVLDYLDFSIIKKNPKIVIGYSDITALTSAITAKTGLITFSGPGLISFIKPEPFDYTWEYFEKVCMIGKPFVVSPSKTFADDQYFLRKDSNHRIIQKNVGWKVFSSGKANGRIVAGNLQTLLVLTKTPYQPNYKNSILFIEEDEEIRPEHFLRFLTQLKQTKSLERLKSLVIGRFCKQTNINFNILTKILKSINFPKEVPILYNVDFGHSDPMITIPNGGYCEIDTFRKYIKFEKAVL